MRFLLWLLAIVSLLWGGYWFVGSSAVEKQAVAAIEDANQSGYDIAYSNLNTIGFPSRFDTTVTDIDVTTPLGVQWIAPFFQVFALSYKPYHVIAVWPHDQSVVAQGNRYRIASSDLRASLVVKPNSTLALDRFQLTGREIKIVRNESAPVAINDLSLASRQGVAPNSHDISLQGNEVSLPALALGRIEIDDITLQANLMFDGVLGRSETPPQLLGLTLSDMGFTKGDIAANLAGDLTFDAEGFANGTLSITAQNWEKGFELAQSLGGVPSEYADTLKTLLSGLAAADGSPDDIQVPLTVRRGKITLGFVPLGYIPPL